MAQVAERPDCRQLSWQREAAEALLGLEVLVEGRLVRITAQTLNVFRTMAAHVNRAGECWVGLDRIAREAGVSPRAKQARDRIKDLRRRHLAPLIAAGAIERLTKGGHGRGSAGAWVVHNLAEKGGHGAPPYDEKGGHFAPEKGGHFAPLEEERNLRRGQASLPVVENAADGDYAPMPSNFREWISEQRIKGEANRIVAQSAPRAERPVQPRLGADIYAHVYGRESDP